MSIVLAVVLGSPLQGRKCDCTGFRKKQNGWLTEMLSPKRVLETKTQSRICSLLCGHGQEPSQEPSSGRQKEDKLTKSACGSQVTSGSRTLSTGTCCYMNEEGVRLLNEMKVVFILE